VRSAKVSLAAAELGSKLWLSSRSHPSSREISPFHFMSRYIPRPPFADTERAVLFPIRTSFPILAGGTFRFAQDCIIEQILSSDTSTTTKFPLASVSVKMLQRVSVVAQGHPGVHDSLVATGEVQHHGPPDGAAPSRGDASGAQWYRDLKGDISLARGLVPSFRSPSIQVSVSQVTPKGGV
jgi:hypothetical protein